MATHLGRNPFRLKTEKPKKTQVTQKKGQIKTAPKSATPLGAESILVKIPAASTVFAFKTLFFVKGLFVKE